MCQRFCDGPFGTVTGVGRIVGRHLRWLHGSPLRRVVLTFVGGSGQSTREEFGKPPLVKFGVVVEIVFLEAC